MQLWKTIEPPRTRGAGRQSARSLDLSSWCCCPETEIKDRRRHRPIAFRGCSNARIRLLGGANGSARPEFPPPEPGPEARGLGDQRPHAGYSSTDGQPRCVKAARTGDHVAQANAGCASWKRGCGIVVHAAMTRVNAWDHAIIGGAAVASFSQPTEAVTPLRCRPAARPSRALPPKPAASRSPASTGASARRPARRGRSARRDSV